MPKLNQEFPNDASGGLFDYIRTKFKLSSDKELSEKTGIFRSAISRIRNGKQPVTKSNKHDISEATGLSIKAIDKLIAEE